MTPGRILRAVVRGGHAEPESGAQRLAFSVQDGCDASLRAPSQISGAVLEPFVFQICCVYVYMYCICIRAACTTVL